VTRRFAAPPEAVYRAHTDPKLVQIRYEWANGKGAGSYLTGEFIELQPYRRIVHVERMHLPDATPDNHIETTFEPDGAGMEASYARLARLI
jgi:uncharacterized protein YndB with AHSA1/START domain